ncbi:MAG: hypothetical protein ABI763_16090, partial [Bacteroidota bacterium]
FPIFWKTIHASTLAIAITNGLLYCLSLAWLAYEYGFSKRNLFIVSSLPSLFFMFLPFSESVFFFTATVFLIGLKKENQFLIGAGLLMSGLARPVATIFIPAIVITEYYFSNGKNLKLRNVYLQLITCIAALLMVFILQYYEIGKWFTFFEYQKNWNNYLREPSLPLSSWAGGYIVRLDAIAFLSGIAAFTWLVSIIVKMRVSEKNLYNRAFILSLAYLGILTLTVLLTKGGVLNSLNRYIFASPFLVLALSTFLERAIFNRKYLLILFLCSTLFWFLFASYVHIQAFLKFETLSLYLCLVYSAANKTDKKISQLSFLSLIGVNIFFFIAFMYRFLSGDWVG